VVLNAGRVEQIGTPEEVYDRPATLFVAGFIGTPPMNTVPVTLTGDTAAVGDSQLPLDRTTIAERAVLGVRPEHLHVDPSGALRAAVQQTEWLGHEALMRLQLVGTEGLIAGWIVRLSTEAAPPEPGTEVRLSAAPGTIHLFDEDTGRRLAGEVSS
jgi:ABC-type sugar transport system ATPase subunit